MAQQDYFLFQNDFGGHSGWGGYAVALGKGRRVATMITMRFCERLTFAQVGGGFCVFRAGYSKAEIDFQEAL